MSVFSIAYRGTTAAALIAGAALLCGFTFRPGGPPELHYREYNAQPPRGNTVTVCHAHGCQLQESFTFTRADISDLSVLMDGLLEAYKLLNESDYNPVLMAALIAFGFVFIHPFEDGNGRIHP